MSRHEKQINNVFNLYGKMYEIRTFGEIIPLEKHKITKEENIMLKGIQKNMIMIKLPRSQSFEAAYFILRSSGKEPRQGEMVREANRIIAESGLCSVKGDRAGRQRWERIMLFIYGVLSGAVSVAALWLGFLIFG